MKPWNKIYFALAGALFPKSDKKSVSISGHKRDFNRSRFRNRLILRSLRRDGSGLYAREEKTLFETSIRQVRTSCIRAGGRFCTRACVSPPWREAVRVYASTCIYGKSDVARTCARRAILICRFQGRLNPRLTPEYNNSWVQWRASKRNSDGRPRDVVRVFLLHRLDINHRNDIAR